MSSLPCLRAQGDVVLLHVKAQPRASRNEIGELLGTELKIKIAAPPVDSAANEMLIKFLAEVLDCPKNKVQLIRGASTRHKTVAIHGMTLDTIAEKLCAAGCE